MYSHLAKSLKDMVNHARMISLVIDGPNNILIKDLGNLVVYHENYVSQ